MIVSHTDRKQTCWRLKWEVVAVHESFTAWHAAGYSFPSFSEIFNSASEEKQSFPTYCLSSDVNLTSAPVPSPPLYSTVQFCLLFLTLWKALKLSSGQCQRYTGGQHRTPQKLRTRKVRKEIPVKTASTFRYFRRSRYPLHTHTEEGDVLLQSGLSL